MYISYVKICPSTYEASHIYLIDMIKTNLNSGEKSKTGEKASAEIDTEIDAERALDAAYVT